MQNDKDLVTRLRWFNTNLQSDSPLIPPMQRICVEAADEIERLRLLIEAASKPPTV